MSMEQQTSVDSGVLYVTVSGKFSLAEGERRFVELMNAVVEHQVAKVFLDGRTVEGHPRVIERFYFGEFAAHMVISYCLRDLCRSPSFAYVLKEPMLDPGRFGENVAVNRGLNFKAFDNVKDAMMWLGVAPGKEAAGLNPKLETRNPKQIPNPKEQ
jgi:hypothetical protein